ncbi:Cytochrome c oxidase subunit 6A [Tilletia horrida]|uniref:Cytochrome c oxidase subunit 6A n=1 Tax=Tilletia horrida TaxID=155126 RepID=A0AAN6G995_9BASI|nr:Cytochrome c oxidase subunit 6A [Tilletia horrida]
MSFARSAFALTARSAAVARRPAVAAVQRRSIASAPVGEEFIKERKHTAEHAAKSADLWRKISMYVCLPGGEYQEPEEKHARAGAHSTSTIQDRRADTLGLLLLCASSAVVLGVYIYGIEAEHIHHRDHEIHENGGELPERVFYEYNNIRKRSFPWGQQSLFFNAKANYPAEEM